MIEEKNVWLLWIICDVMFDNLSIKGQMQWPQVTVMGAISLKIWDKDFLGSLEKYSLS